MWYRKVWGAKVDRLPPSKNRIFVSDEAKRRYAEYLRESGASKAFNYVLQHRDREYVVRITFYLRDGRKYRTFEPHNYIDAIMDAVFSPSLDNLARRLEIEKVRGDTDCVEIEILEVVHERA